MDLIRMHHQGQALREHEEDRRETVKMSVDVHFDFSSEAHGRDIDTHSPTLKHYHKLLWSKDLPNGERMELEDGGTYLVWRDFSFGSDAITHSYRNHKRKQAIIGQVAQDADELYRAGCTIGAYLIFPSNRVNDLPTINQARGTLRMIDDRFDLTLECIRRFYAGVGSPLSDTLLRYRSFFDLFRSFRGYVEFFLLQDLVTDDCAGIRFYLPFDDFVSEPMFRGREEYLLYKKAILRFVQSRNSRIEEWCQHNEADGRTI